jgi:hypothetical protein
MSQIYYSKTDYNYKGKVKEIFIESYANLGSLENTEIGNKLSSDRRIFINDQGRIASIYYIMHPKIKSGN